MHRLVLALSLHVYCHMHFHTCANADARPMSMPCRGLAYAMTHMAHAEASLGIVSEMQWSSIALVFVWYLWNTHRMVGSTSLVLVNY